MRQLRDQRVDFRALKWLDDRTDVGAPVFQAEIERIARGDDDRQLGVHTENISHQIQAGHQRQADVGGQYVERLGAEYRQSFLSGAERYDLSLFRAQQFVGDFPNHGIVFDVKNLQWWTQIITPL